MLHLSISFFSLISFASGPTSLNSFTHFSSFLEKKLTPIKFWISDPHHLSFYSHDKWPPFKTHSLIYMWSPPQIKTFFFPSPRRNRPSLFLSHALQRRIWSPCARHLCLTPYRTSQVSHLPVSLFLSLIWVACLLLLLSLSRTRVDSAGLGLTRQDSAWLGQKLGWLGQKLGNSAESDTVHPSFTPKLAQARNSALTRLGPARVRVDSESAEFTNHATNFLLYLFLTWNFTELCPK